MEHYLEYITDNQFGEFEFFLNKFKKKIQIAKTTTLLPITLTFIPWFPPNQLLHSVKPPPWPGRPLRQHNTLWESEREPQKNTFQVKREKNGKTS